MPSTFISGLQNRRFHSCKIKHKGMYIAYPCVLIMELPRHKRFESHAYILKLHINFHHSISTYKGFHNQDIQERVSPVHNVFPIDSTV